MERLSYIIYCYVLGTIFRLDFINELIIASIITMNEQNTKSVYVDKTLCTILRASTINLI